MHSGSHGNDIRRKGGLPALIPPVCLFLHSFADKCAGTAIHSGIEAPEYRLTRRVGLFPFLVNWTRRGYRCQPFPPRLTHLRFHRASIIGCRILSPVDDFCSERFLPPYALSSRFQRPPKRGIKNRNSYALFA